MRLAEALKIIDTPPTVLETFFFDTPTSRWEYQKIVGSGGLPERWRAREHTIHGVGKWEHVG